MHPLSYIKAHKGATVVTFAAGMMIGPWLLNMLNSKTGVGISLPSYGSSGD